MTEIRALTLILDDPSTAAAALRDVFGWTIEADFGSFASLTLPEGIPLWLNAPDEGSAVARGIVVHLSAEDVDASFREAVDRGATVQREPMDMDFGERSACVTVSAIPGITFDIAQPLG